jgi:hypothetical protein
MSAATPTGPTPARHRPKSFTVFAAAFLAGAAAAVGVNRVLDVQLAQRKPQVECEPIFVALRSLPQGAPVTVWDVALKDWPKAMLPASALRANDSFDGFVLRHALREGQPLLAVQLVRDDHGAGTGPAAADESFIAPVPAAASAQADLWTPGGTATTPPPAATAASPKSAATPVEPATPAPTAVATTTADIEPAAPVKAVEPKTEPTTEREPEIVTATPVAAQPTAADVVPEPTPVVASEAPAVAAQRVELPPVAPTIAAAPSDIEPLVRDPLLRQRPTEVEPDGELTDAVPPDVASMPSVMTPSNGSAADARPAGKASSRYLVVPERVAIQADTSFTTPRPEPPGPPVVGAVSRSSPTRPQSGAVGQRQQPQQPAASVGRTLPRREQTGREQSNRPQQGRAQQPSQQRGRQPAAPQQPQQQPQPQQQRAWGGFFPNMAAGIDAMGGSWQKSRSGSNQQPAGGQPARR